MMNTTNLGRFDATILSLLAARDFGGGVQIRTLRAGLALSDEAFDLGIRTMVARGLVRITCQHPGMPEVTAIAAC